MNSWCSHIMIKELILPMAGVAIFIALVGLLIKNSGNITIPGIPTPVPAVSTKTVKVGEISLSVEVANTPQARAQGLSGRTDIVGDSGMVFVFDPADKTPNFWMKGMLIPIDIIWIKNGTIVKIDKNVQPPAPDTADSALPLYSPRQAIDNVLEVRGGYSDENGIKVGTKVDLSGI